MKRILIVLTLIVLSMNVFGQTPKYIFLFIGDGMGPNTVYFTDLYDKTVKSESQGVNFFNFPVRSLISTYSADAYITDSSAAGTALSSGVKINNGALGYAPDGSFPVNLAEIAKRNGYGAGVVTSVGVNHATPAAFYGHVERRSYFNELAEQLIRSDIDFAAGSTFLTKDDVDPQVFVDKARAAGINVFCGKDEYKPVKGGRVIFLNSDLRPSSLAYSIDRKDGDTQLSDFTSAAIDHLYSNYKKGFFLMVEGGKIDYATHATDAATAIAEVNDMAKSIDLALDFMAEHPKETLILVTADHDTGGLGLNRHAHSLTLNILEYQRLSKDSLSFELAKLRNETGNSASWTQVKEVLRTELGLWDHVSLTKEQEHRLTQVYKETFLDDDKTREVNLYSSNERLAAAAIDCLAEAVNIVWPFSGHSGAPVLLSAKGVHAEAFATCMDNTDVPKTIIKVARFK